MCIVISSSLFDYISDRYATHVARRLLALIAGREVVPATKKTAGGNKVQMLLPKCIAAFI
jgi:hypothetical protein